MVKNTITNQKEYVRNYADYTDKYFLRSKEILQKERINPIVRYQVFARHDIRQLKGIEEAAEFIKYVVGNKARVYALKDGFEYKAKEPIMKIEGRIQDIIDLETVYLGILAGNLTAEIDMEDVRRNAREIINAAEGKPVFYFGARHFFPYFDEEIARICKEEGFVGCSSDIGARAWNNKGIGTIPHALIISYAAHMYEYNIKGNPTVEAARGFDKHIEKTVPRIVLIDTFNREIADSLETAKALKNLSGVRIDTCGENYAQGSIEAELPKLDVPKKYLKGNGVTISAVWALREAFRKEGNGDLEIVVSSGFNAEKTAAFLKADKAYQEMHRIPLFNSIGTGSIANPIMTTSDIVAYFSEKQEKWIPLSKIGREELKSGKLHEVM